MKYYQKETNASRQNLNTGDWLREYYYMWANCVKFARLQFILIGLSFGNLL